MQVRKGRLCPPHVHCEMGEIEHVIGIAGRRRRWVGKVRNVPLPVASASPQCPLWPRQRSNFQRGGMSPWARKRETCTAANTVAIDHDGEASEHIFLPNMEKPPRGGSPKFDKVLIKRRR